MKEFARSALTRAGQVVLRQLERRQETLRQQVVKRLDRLDERVEQALAQAQQNAALLAASRRGPARGVVTRGKALPRSADALPEPVAPVPTFALSHDIEALTACPACGSERFTLVAEFNRFLTSGQAPDTCASRYDYSLCHG